MMGPHKWSGRQSVACLQNGFSAQDPQEQAVLQDALEDICLVIDLTCVDLRTHTPVEASIS